MIVIFNKLAEEHEEYKDDIYEEDEEIEEITNHEEDEKNETDENVNDTLLNLELQISEDKSDIIKIRENDDVNEVVDTFCKKYNYGKKVKNMIMERLIDALNNNIGDCIYN